MLKLSRRALFLAAAAAGAQCALISGAGAQTLTKIRVAVVPIDLDGAPLYALAQGFFRKRNLDVELVMMTNGPATAAAVIGGSLELGTAAVITIANARERGIPFVMVAPGAAYSSKQATGSLIALQASPLRSAKDLVGKTVAVLMRALGPKGKDAGWSNAIDVPVVPPLEKPTGLAANRDTRRKRFPDL